MLSRVLEPEVMDTAEEADDYDAMDHREVNSTFCDDLAAEAPALRRTLDLGTGTALIPIELCRRFPDALVLGIDLAKEMLRLGQRNVATAGLEGRVTLEERDAKATGLDGGGYDTVVSNSLVHHIEDTAALLGEMRRLVDRGGLLFVRDLLRPNDEDALVALVERYASLEHDGDGDASRAPRVARSRRQRALFEASLRAALTVDEVLLAATKAGLHGARVRPSSDRHFTLVWTAR